MQQEKRSYRVGPFEKDSLFTDDELHFLGSMDALCRDADGRTVLRGLTRQETQAYMAGHRASMDAAGPLADPAYLSLSRKHHEARFEALRPPAPGEDA